MPCVCAALGTLGLASLAETLTPSSPCCGPPIPRTLSPNPRNLGTRRLSQLFHYQPSRRNLGEPSPSFLPPNPTPLAHHRCAATLAQPRESHDHCVPATYVVRLGYVCRTFVVDLGTLSTGPKACGRLSQTTASGYGTGSRYSLSLLKALEPKSSSSKARGNRALGMEQGRRAVSRAGQRAPRAACRRGRGCFFFSGRGGFVWPVLDPLGPTVHHRACLLGGVSGEREEIERSWKRIARRLS